MVGAVIYEERYRCRAAWALVMGHREELYGMKTLKGCSIEPAPKESIALMMRRSKFRSQEAVSQVLCRSEIGYIDMHISHIYCSILEGAPAATCFCVLAIALLHFTCPIRWPGRGHFLYYPIGTASI